jgi:acyl-coenzyme A thioesterase PaaI-like protein
MSMNQEPEDHESWLRTAEQGWTEIEGQDLVTAESFVSGKASPLSVRYFAAEENAVRAKVIFGPGTQGPPGCAHGGSMAAMLDEIMAFIVWHTGCAAMSMEIRVRYRKMLQIPQRCIADARIENIENRRVTTSARLHNISGTMLFAEAEAVFLEMVDRTQLKPTQSA